MFQNAYPPVNEHVWKYLIFRFSGLFLLTGLMSATEIINLSLQYTAVLVIIILGAAFYNKLEAIGCPRVDRTLPRLKGHLPIIGSLLFPMEQLTENFLEHLHQHPKTKAHVATYPFTNPVVWITDPEIIEYITIKNFDNYIKGEFLSERLEDVLGSGIFKF